MTNKQRAALWFLSDTDIESVDWKIQDLENYDSETMANIIVNVWKPFEYYTVAELLTQIENLEEQFNDCQKPLFDDIIKAKTMIRDFRDSDDHICGCHENVDDINGQCTCEPLDRVIDVLSD